MILIRSTSIDVTRAPGVGAPIVITEHTQHGPEAFSARPILEVTDGQAMALMHALSNYLPSCIGDPKP